MSTKAEWKTRFKGCYVATLTPFDSQGRVDLGVVRAHTAWLIENGIEGLCPVGTTGEFLFLSESEKSAIIRATVEGASGRVPVLAGVWATTPEEINRLAKGAEDTGADGVFLPTPIYYPATQTTIYDWYEGAKRATSLPVFAYNIPQYAANEITFDTLQHLLDAGIIAGVKDSTGKAERVGELVKRFGQEHTVFAASDSFATEGRKLGADGFISAIANAVPALFAKLWAGDESLQSEVDTLRSALKKVGSLPALKFLLVKQGFAFGGVRIPYSDLTEAQKKDLEGLG